MNFEEINNKLEELHQTFVQGTFGYNEVEERQAYELFVKFMRLYENEQRLKDSLFHHFNTIF